MRNEPLKLENLDDEIIKESPKVKKNEVLPVTQTMPINLNDDDAYSFSNKKPNLQNASAKDGEVLVD